MTDGPDHHGTEPDLSGLTADAQRAARRMSGAIAGGTLVLLHGAVGWFTLTLGLVAPPWAVGALLVVWATIGVVAWRWRTRRPIATMLAPFVMAALLLGAVALGGELLGWSA